VKSPFAELSKRGYGARSFKLNFWAAPGFYREEKRKKALDRTVPDEMLSTEPMRHLLK